MRLQRHQSRKRHDLSEYLVTCGQVHAVMEVLVLVLRVPVREQLHQRCQCPCCLLRRQQALQDCHPVGVELRFSLGVELLIDSRHGFSGSFTAAAHRLRRRWLLARSLLLCECQPTRDDRVDDRSTAVRSQQHIIRNTKCINFYISSNNPPLFDRTSARDRAQRRPAQQSSRWPSARRRCIGGARSGASTARAP